MNLFVRCCWVLLLGLLGTIAFQADAFEPGTRSSIGRIAASELPPEARETLALIKKGGPFPYKKDGTVFSNREKVLPLKPRGHYKEFTVRTPGAKSRGARRIVSGDGIHYYTEDHYQSFKRILEGS